MVWADWFICNGSLVVYRHRHAIIWLARKHYNTVHALVLIWCAMYSELKLIHAQPFWWALIELILVPHWHDSKRHPPWWVDMGVIFVFLSSWAVHYVTFYKLTDHYIYGNAWTPLRWLLYSAMLPLYIVIRLLTYVRFKLAIRCGKRYGANHLHRTTIVLTHHCLPSL